MKAYLSMKVSMKSVYFLCILGKEYIELLNSQPTLPYTHASSLSIEDNAYIKFGGGTL